MPKVYNMHHGKIPEGAINVARPSIFGNPFTHLHVISSAAITVPDRETAVRFYDLMIDCEYSYEILDRVASVSLRKARNLVAQAQMIRNTVHELKGKDLVCYCAPLPCHADILIRRANEE